MKSIWDLVCYVGCLLSRVSDRTTWTHWAGLRTQDMAGYAGLDSGHGRVCWTGLRTWQGMLDWTQDMAGYAGLDSGQDCTALKTKQGKLHWTQTRNRTVCWTGPRTAEARAGHTGLDQG